MNNLQTGSVLDYTLTFLQTVLSRARDRWDLAPKSGLIEITHSKEYHRIYSGLQFVSSINLTPHNSSVTSQYISIVAEVLSTLWNKCSSTNALWNSKCDINI